MASFEPARIFVVDDDKVLAWEISQRLTPEGYEVETFGSAEDAVAAMAERPAALAIVDLNLPGLSGMEFLEQVKSSHPETQVVILTGHGTIQGAVQATKKGAYAYLTKPADYEQVKIEIRNALEKRALQDENVSLKAQLAARSQPSLLGSSKAMQEVASLVRKIGPYDVSVLIAGESGTGKEVVARSLHQLSPRGTGPFVSVDCGALPDHLVESELFGYEKGAFTGAMVAKPGRFHLAHRGTLFLDEIGNLQPAMQVKLLRVLQERSFTRLGGRAEEKVDVRVVAATNAALEVAIRQGRFREDLYHRVNQFKIALPPLRERRSDIPALARHFAKEYAKEFGKKVEGFSEGALEVLRRYNFPGNVRELQNVVRHAVVLGDETIEEHHLPEEVVRAARSGGGAIPSPVAVASDAGASGVDPLDLRSASDRAEREAVAKALEATGWHQEKAAKLVGVTAKTLSAKMRQFGLRKPKP